MDTLDVELDHVPPRLLPMGSMAFQFEDPDALAELLVQDHFQLINLGPTTGRDSLELLTLPDLVVRHAEHTTSWHAVGQLPEDQVHFIVPLAGEAGGRFLGEPVQVLDVLFQEGGTEHHTAATGGRFIYLPVNRHLFDSFSRAWLGEAVPRVGPGMLLRPRPDQGVRMRSTIERVLRQTRHPAAPGNGPELQAQLLSVLAEPFVDLMGNAPDDRWSHAERLVQFRSARDWIMDHLGERFQLHELCAGVGMPERSLRRLFGEFVGMSPIPYIRHLRLTRAHRLLKAGAPDTMSVKYAALDSGFWEIGRFCAIYKNTYGELPSRTLRSRR